jgi:hypothetical protein
VLINNRRERPESADRRGFNKSFACGEKASAFSPLICALGWLPA